MAPAVPATHTLTAAYATPRAFVLPRLGLRAFGASATNLRPINREPTHDMWMTKHAVDQARHRDVPDVELLLQDSINKLHLRLQL
jgi:hypothetical protein